MPEIFSERLSNDIPILNKWNWQKRNLKPSSEFLVCVLQWGKSRYACFQLEIVNLSSSAG
jgi:hypothetical protein